MVDGLVLNNAFFVNQKQRAVGDEVVGGREQTVLIVVILAGEHVVIGGDGLVRVAHKRIGDARHAAFVLRDFQEGQMRFNRIGRATHDDRIALLKLGQLVLKGDELRRAQGGEVLRVEEQDNVLLADVVREREVGDDFPVDDGFRGEGGGRAGDEG